MRQRSTERAQVMVRWNRVSKVDKCSQGHSWWKEEYTGQATRHWDLSCSKMEIKAALGVLLEKLPGTQYHPEHLMIQND